MICSWMFLYIEKVLCLSKGRDEQYFVWQLWLVIENADEKYQLDDSSSTPTCK